MTVGELISELEKLPEDMNVMMDNGEATVYVDELHVEDLFGSVKRAVLR